MTALAAPAPRQMSDAQFALVIVLAVSLLNAAIIFVPLGYSLWLSVHESNVILRSMDFVGFKHYLTALHDPKVLAAAGRSLAFTVIAVVLSFLLSLSFALILNENFPGKGILRALVLLPWAVSQVVTATIFSFMLNPNVGALNALLAPLGIVSPSHVWLTADMALVWVAVAFVWHIAPLGTFFYLAALQTIPEDLYNAARIDRAGPVHRFLHITLPSLRHTTLIVMVVMTVDAVRQFDLVFSLTRGGPGTSSQILPMLVFRYNFEFSQYGFAAATSFILTAMSIILAVGYFMLLNRKKKAPAHG
jgi:multiple sugar transport system permease protein